MKLNIALYLTPKEKYGNIKLSVKKHAYKGGKYGKNKRIYNRRRNVIT